MSCGRSMWLMVSKLELWLVSLTVMFALVSRVLRTRVEYEEQHCLSVCWIMVQLPVIMCAPCRCRDAPTDRLHSLQAELTVQNRSPLPIYLFPLVSSRHWETQRTEQDMTSQEKKHGA
ncbi:hypothetical protein FOXYSP1_13886 [Fusarium oxysporum f. sp. phaseoli]